MINIGFGANFLLAGIILFGMITLYGLRSIRSELCRDEDIFFTTLGIIYSSILLIHGWRLDPILLFSQVLIISILLGAGWENIRLRGIIYSKLRNQQEFSPNFSKYKRSRKKKY